MIGKSDILKNSQRSKMPAINKVILVGNLCQDPEKRSTPQGHSVVSVSLATNESYKGKDGSKQQSTEYHKLVFWNQVADIVSTYCKKGSLIYVEGKLQTRKWTDKDNIEKYTTEIVVSQMQMLDSKPSGNQSQQQSNQGNQYDPYQTPPQR